MVTEIKVTLKVESKQNAAAHVRISFRYDRRSATVQPKAGDAIILIWCQRPEELEYFCSSVKLCMQHTSRCIDQHDFFQALPVRQQSRFSIDQLICFYLDTNSLTEPQSLRAQLLSRFNVLRTRANVRLKSLNLQYEKNYDEHVRATIAFSSRRVITIDEPRLIVSPPRNVEQITAQAHS